MKNLKNKISAFTLVEVIMVMILSLLVLGIIMLGFRHFQQYRAIQGKGIAKNRGYFAYSIGLKLLVL